MTVRCLFDWICIEPIIEDRWCGFIIPRQAQNRPNKGKVIAIGPGKENENGEFVPIDDIKINDVVYWPGYAEESNIYDRQTFTRRYVFLRKSDLMAVTDKD